MANKEISIGVKLVTDLKDFTSGFKQAQDTSAKFGDNIEKNVSTPLNKLAGQLRTLKTAQSRSLTPEQFASIGKEIEKVQGDIDKFKGKITQTSSPLDNMLSQAKGLLPAFGFAAIGAGAVYAFNEIKNSTDTLKTDWEAMTNGMSEGLNEFWRTIATGDWSNFTERISEAIDLGEQYIYTLDDIEDKTRSLSIIEANSRKQELDLEEKLKNKGLSKTERLKAGEERIKLEEDLAKTRTELAQEVFDNEAKLTAQQTKLSKEQLMNVMSDFNSVSKIRAKDYNEKVDQLKKLQQTKVSGSSYSFGNTSALIEGDNSDLISKLKTEINSASEATKIYAAEIRKTGRTSDEQLDKMVASYVALKNAENSAAENTKKTRTMVNSLLADEEKTGSKKINSANTYAEKLKKLTTQLDETNVADTEAIRLIYAKINALNQLEAANEAVRKSIRNEGNEPVAAITPIGAGQLSTTPVDTKTLATNSPINADAIAAEIKKINDAEDALIEKQQAVKEAFQSGFQAIGQSVVNGLGLADTGFQGFVKNLANTVTQLVSMFLAQSLSSSIAGASVSGAATGPAAIFTTPAFIATAISGVLAAFAAIPKFATGGVVPGTSFNGDKVLARVNSGEEILTASDPRHRNNRGAAGSGSGTEITIMNEARIKGEDIYILMKKHERRLSRRT